MEVLVETLTGTAFEMTVSPSDTVFAIKSKIFRVEGIPVSQQHLVYNLKELENWSSLGEHAIGAGARLRLVLGMRGGPVATRRLPPPEPWRDIERMLDTDRDEGASSSREGGCKMTVLVFRDGERVSMLSVRENRDGTYSPLDHNKCPRVSEVSHLPDKEYSLVEGPCRGALHDNAVTMGKMMDLRRRMETLTLTRPQLAARNDKADIQKTRSEETLSRQYETQPDTFTPTYDGAYTGYEYEPNFPERGVLGAWLSSSTSRLETLGALPALSRHANREHLHLSDDLLHRPPPDKKPPRLRCAFCKKRLSIATVHKCRCGASFCAPHRYAEVHGCAYDYKARPHPGLGTALLAPKLPKI